MSYLVINGGKKLTGSINNQTNKNSTVAIICASLMIKGTTVLKDVPRIEEVDRMLELVKSLGVKVTKPSPTSIKIDASSNLKAGKLDRHSSEATRASLLLWGALANRVKRYNLYTAGGCRLGARTVKPHVLALKDFGIKIKSLTKFYQVTNPVGLKAANIVMYESGDTATENVIMAAVLAKGTTTIKMASANYMVQDLCYFLQAAGAKISGIGTTTLTITGVKKLKPVKNYPIMPDPIVAMAYIAAAIVTSSKLTIKNCPIEFLELELLKLSVMGQKYEIKNKHKSKNKKFDIVDIVISPSNLKALKDKIYGRPFPGLNIDNLPLFVPILLKATGRTLIHDWIYENRALYMMELQKLGAKVNLVDPHRLWVEGPSKLKAAEVICPPGIRPAVAVFVTMLAAKGKSILRNTYMIERGYENMYEVLNKVGADIKVVE
jgi:UDP-N-acetylglucosamine 1-carboxyvinyltransferase